MIRILPLLCVAAVEAEKQLQKGAFHNTNVRWNVFRSLKRPIKCEKLFTKLSSACAFLQVFHSICFISEFQVTD